METKPFGSGYFGEWIKDDFGLPAYKYTCNQLKDPKADTPMNDIWRARSDHLFLVGNDRLVGVASNFGYIMVRQDEGAPKYLNYHIPELNQYAGGFGYLTDNKDLLSTYYRGQDVNFKRIFGIGYFSKKVSNQSYAVNHTIFAPFGDDPLLISQVKIRNKTPNEVDLRWIEYWGCFNFQFSFQATINSISEKNVNPLKDYRINLEKQSNNKVIVFNKNRGIVNLKYNKKSPKLEQQLDVEKRTKGVRIQAKKPSFEDRNPPPIFLVSLDDQATGFHNNATTFFGEGGIEIPDGLKRPLDLNDDINGPETCLILERAIKLKPNESKTLYFTYGYIPEGYDLENMIEKYRNDLPNLLKRCCEAWKQTKIECEIKEDSWIERELFWSYYYLRGALTYDDFFEEHILSQGHVYQYIMGFQGAARDPLQHALPFLFTEPRIVKEILRYTLKEVQADGKIPYGISGNGMIMPSLWDPSDLQLWLLWLLSDYVLSTRDIAFLNEPISMYPIYGRKAQTKTVWDIVFLTFNYFINVIGRGKHGLIRVASCDWNDMVIAGFVPKEKQEEVKKIGESVLNSAMAVYVLTQFSEMLLFIGKADQAKMALELRNSLIKAIQNQWNGKWFNRAWLSDDLGWVGNDILWLEPQPWALISHITNKSQTETLIKNINELNRKRSQIGAILLSKPPEHLVEPAGMATNAGIWPSINGTLIWALSQFDGVLAYDEWKKNLFGNKANVYPYIWYGIWSGADTWNSSFSEYPGHTLFNKYYMTKNPIDLEKGLLSMGINWTDFPVLNLHPHAWPLYNIFNFLGVRFIKDGIEFTPKFPKDEYRIISKIIGFERKSNTYQGFYAPLTTGDFLIKIILDAKELSKIKKAEVNGKEIQFEVLQNSIQFRGKASSTQSLAWKLSS
jgi:hypothetical protein